MDYHWSTLDSNRLWTILADRGLSWFDMDYRDYSGLLRNMAYHGVLWIIIEYHQLV